MGDVGSIPGLGRSHGERKGYPLQYSGLENSMDHSPWGCEEMDMTERLSVSLQMSVSKFRVIPGHSPHRCFMLVFTHYFLFVKKSFFMI